VNGLDKIIKGERKYRYKRLKKLRKARDMSKNYRKTILKLSTVNGWFREGEHEELFTNRLARAILSIYERELNRPKIPKPPVRKKG
jgi:hypothetical protein